MELVKFTLKSLLLLCVLLSLVGSLVLLPEPPIIENGAHGTENLMLKIQVSEDCA